MRPHTCSGIIVAESAPINSGSVNLGTAELLYNCSNQQFASKVVSNSPANLGVPAYDIGENAVLYTDAQWNTCVASNFLYPPCQAEAAAGSLESSPNPEVTGFWPDAGIQSIAKGSIEVHAGPYGGDTGSAILPPY